MKKIHNLLFSYKKNMILLLIGLLIQLFYIGYAKSTYTIGFPLDDSWIHQTYARNLLQYGGWFYNQNVQSAGSTAPLWTILLIPGHLFKNFYFVWTFFISYLLYICSAIIFQKIVEVMSSTSQKKPWAGALFLLEWHIAWISTSGMETILFVCMILLVFYLLIKNSEKPNWLLFVLVGLIVFVRPDGITLLGPLLFIYIMNAWKYKIKPSKKLLSGLLIILLLISFYAIFNFMIAGDFLPNTFYAKQAEYESIYTSPLLIRYLNLIMIPITGVGIILLPGFIYTIHYSIKKTDVNKVAMILWIFGYILIYAIRLPVTYQHGRYITPTIPIYLILSLLGTFEINKNIKARNQVINFGYKSLISVLLVVFLFLGGEAYANDVAIIQTEMVEPAKWINQNLENDAVIAAHDIGALGFYSNRKIIDLAGLISPEVIPYLRDENKLADYLYEKKADFLLVFPGWYDTLDDDKTIIFSTNANFSTDAGGENVKLYKWE